MQVTERSFESFQAWPDTTVWPDMGVEAIGIRPISRFEGPRNRSSDLLFSRVKSMGTNEFTRVIGSKCEKNSECNQRVPRSHCSYGQRCECLFSFNYDKATDSCYRVKSYNDRCSFSDGCHNVLLRCSEFGLCTCHHGFHYEFGKNPYCQPNNSSACDPGQTWDPMRARCVRPRIHTLFTDSTPHFANGGYDRNRYSLFFSVILILVLMVILFKSKKSHPFTWDRRSRRMSRSISYAEALGYAFGVRTNAPSNHHPSHVIPPPHQGPMPFDVPGEFYDWNPHHHHHHVVHHPHLQSLVVTMPHSGRDGNSVATANGSCHLVSDIMGIPDSTAGTTGVSSSIIADTSNRLSSSTVDATSTACIPPPPYASTLSLATACATITDSDGDGGSSDTQDTNNRISSRSIFSTEKPPTYEEAIRYDSTLLPVATADINNNCSNNSASATCNNSTVACVPGNCRCTHLPCGQSSGAFFCLSNSPSVNRCHSTTMTSNVNERSNALTGVNDMTDVPTMIHNRSIEDIDSTNARAAPTDASNVIVTTTTQHCSTSHVPYLTPPVHSLPFSARLRDYPYPVSPWPVVQGVHSSSSSSRSERYRLHRSSRPMNYGRTHSIRNSRVDNNHNSSDTPTVASTSSFISLLRRGTSFMAGVASRNRSSSVNVNSREGQSSPQQQSQSQHSQSNIPQMSSRTSSGCSFSGTVSTTLPSSSRGGEVVSSTPPLESSEIENTIQDTTDTSVDTSDVHIQDISNINDQQLMNHTNVCNDNQSTARDTSA